MKSVDFRHWTNEIKKKHTWFSRKIFTFYRKWKIKNAVVLDVRSAAHLETFLIKQGVLFLHVSNVSGVYRGVRLRSHVWYAEACNVMNKLEIETKSLFFFSNMMKANLHKCYLLLNSNNKQKIKINKEIIMSSQ